MVKPVAQVISVHPDGSISGLQRKQGDGLDLTTLGRAAVRRSSEVVWAEMDQGWFIRLLDAPYANLRLTEILWNVVVGTAPSGAVGVMPSRDGHVLLFRHYEDAVAAEIRFLDSARIQGRLMVSPSESCSSPTAP